MAKPSIPKGTRDFSPVEMAKRNYIFDTIRSVYALYGFQQIETPAMETLQTLMGKYGEEGDKLLFKVLNSGDCLAKINDEELVLIGRMFGYPGMDFENKCWLILGKYDLDMLVLTCGVNGSYVFSKGAMSYLETPKVEVADTVGAGDSFTGSFVASVLNGKPIAEAHRIGVNVSAYGCPQNGAKPVIPEALTS